MPGSDCNGVCTIWKNDCSSALIWVRCKMRHIFVFIHFRWLVLRKRQATAHQFSGHISIIYIYGDSVNSPLSLRPTIFDGKDFPATLLAPSAGRADGSGCISKQTALSQITLGTSNQRTNSGWFAAVTCRGRGGVAGWLKQLVLMQDTGEHSRNH